MPTAIPRSSTTSTVGAPAFTYSRELSDRELPAFNPWNLLRAAPNAPADDWDPAGVRGKYESAGQGNLPFRIALTNGAPSIRTGGPGATIGATVTPVRADQTITWSTKSDLVSLSRTTGSNVVVTGRNTTNQAEWVAVTATASNGFYVTAYVYVEPKYIRSAGGDRGADREFARGRNGHGKLHARFGRQGGSVARFVVHLRRPLREPIRGRSLSAGETSP